MVKKPKNSEAVMRRKVGKTRRKATPKDAIPASATRLKPKRRIPPLAPQPTYGAKKKKSPAKRTKGALGRLVKFVKGDYNK